MPAEVIRTSTNGAIRQIAIECERAQYQLTLKAAVDFNGQFIGYNAWLRKHNELFLTEDEAIAAALAAVERIAMAPAQS